MQTTLNLVDRAVLLALGEQPGITAEDIIDRLDVPGSTIRTSLSKLQLPITGNYGYISYVGDRPYQIFLTAHGRQYVRSIGGNLKHDC